jgi:chromosome segregation ATPase
VTEPNPTAGPAAAAATKPTSVQELVKAWRVNGRKAQVLESRLHQAVEVARRYRRDLLRLAEQNRHRKIQAETLQQKLLQLLEQRSAPPPDSPELPPLPPGDDQVPAEYVRHLLLRLREAHELVAEFESLLEFREKQVHELLSRQASGAETAPDWRVFTLQRELTEARHRIRLLTQELAGQTPAGEDAGLRSRVAELEQRLAESASGGAGADAALQAQLAQRDQQIAQLQDQLNLRVEELKKALPAIHAARDRIAKLEADLEEARHQDEAAELLTEITTLQDEIARLNEENESLSKGAPAAAVADPALASRVQQLEAENATLRASTADPVRMAKLEAGVVELRGKLQLAGSKYQEVKAALIEKHQQLVALQNRSQETEKKGEFLEPLVRTLEAALEDSRRENAALQLQLEEQKKRANQAEAAGIGAGAADSSEAMASLEGKLKEARRSAVRAQAEAGLKRKEVAKLQEEVEALKARVAQLGG